MSSNSALSQLVSGPFPAAERRLNVMEGQRAVILKNGRAWGLRRPGANGGLLRRWHSESNLPLTGEITYLLFARTPVLETLSAEVELVDGSRVSVSADVRAQPMWVDDDETILTVVARYGVDVVTLRSEMRSALLGDYQALVREALNRYGHDRLHGELDPRTLLGHRTTGFLEITAVTNVLISRDAVSEAAVQARRQAEVESAKLKSNLGLEGLRRSLEELRQETQLILGRNAAISDAELVTEVSRLYAVSPWEYLHPDLVRAEQGEYRAIIGSLVTDNADMLLLLAQQAGGIDEVLRQVGQSLDGAGRPVAPPPWEQTAAAEFPHPLQISSEVPRWQLDEVALKALSNLGPHYDIDAVGAAAAPSHRTTASISVLAVLADGSALRTGVHQMDLDGGHTISALVVCDRADKVDVFLDLLGLVQVVTSSRIDVTISDHVRSDGGRIEGAASIAVTSIAPQQPIQGQFSEEAIGRWFAGLDRLVTGTQPTIMFSI